MTKPIQLPWESKATAHGRPITVEIRDDIPCSNCEIKKPCLVIDTADGEYLAFACCAECAVSLIGQLKA